MSDLSINESNESDLYKAPQTNVLRDSGEFDETSMFNPSGRANRLGYLAYSFGVSFLVMMIATAVMAMLLAGFSENDEVAATISTSIIGIAYVILLPITTIFMIRRFHDFDWSGWWSLTLIVPLVNLIFGLMLLFRPGIAGPNRFGNPPKPSKGGLVIVLLFVFLIVVGILAAIAIPAYQDYMKAAQEAQQLQQ